MLVGCGSNGGAPDSSGGSTATVSARTVSGVGTVLVSSTGSTLYVTEQDSGGVVRCAAECAMVWPPLTVSGTPTAGDGITGALATVSRPDGTTQVTYNGSPLYSFSLDPGPGQVKGNGVIDSFAGTNFVWHAATPTGAAPTPTATGRDGY